MKILTALDINSVSGGDGCWCLTCLRDKSTCPIGALQMVMSHHAPGPTGIPGATIDWYGDLPNKEQCETQCRKINSNVMIWEATCTPVRLDA